MTALPKGSKPVEKDVDFTEVKKRTKGKKKLK